MELDKALERLRDLPDSELIPVARQLEEDAAYAIARRDRARGEILTRLMQNDADVLDGGSEIVQVNFQRSYEWDADTVALNAPGFVEFKEKEVIPAHWEVTDTRGLNLHIKKLGSTPKAEALKSARRVKREVPKFKYMTVKGEDEE